MKFIIAISLLIVGVAYANARAVSGDDIAAKVDLGVGLPMAQLKWENAHKSNLGATVNSLGTAVKGMPKKLIWFLRQFS